MEGAYSGMDRRDYKRVRMNCTVIYRINEPPVAHFVMKGKDIEAKMIDIGQGGMAMVTSLDIPVSTVLSMRFALVNVDKEAVKFSGPLEVTGEVRSNSLLEKNEHRLGIYFKKMKNTAVR
jgi:c-di-GMP-binding flagellar brake protein YcgR